MDAYLALEDGFILKGKSFTGECDSCGEVIFNTGMTGYQEVLTDPSYTGQMICMTYPLVGNYGINEKDVESERVHVSALIVKECCKIPANWQANESLPDYLKRHNIVGIEGIDTRALTTHLRTHGALSGVISTKISDEKELVKMAQAVPKMAGQNLVCKVSPDYAWRLENNKIVKISFEQDGTYKWQNSNKIKLAVFDFGIKWNIIRLLEAQGFEAIMFPSTAKASEIIASGASALFLSNGPGDPEVLTDIICNIKELVGKMPIAGICLGHQLLCLALGGKTYKLKFGHHGLNHPVKDLQTGKIEISSQNHGFCVNLDGVNDVEATHINLNDDTLEGFKHTKHKIIAVQHHPEASPGPNDCQTFFDNFKAMM